MKINMNLLHEIALNIVKRLHSVEFELIEVLMQIDEAKGYLELGYNSLYDYAIRALKLSEASASNFITVARKSKTIPELKVAIKEGELSVAKARKITPVLTNINSTMWIEKAKTLPKTMLEKELAKLVPQSLTPERAKYVSESRLELRCGVSEEIMQLLKRAQDIVSQNKRAAANYEETLKEVLTVFLQKKDPLEKAKRNANLGKESLGKESLGKEIAEQGASNKNDTAASVPDIRLTKNTYANPRYIPATLKHNIYLRDNGQCTHTYDGRRCENRRWLDIHHQIPIAKGGKTTQENLITLCSGHHKQQHMRV